MSRLIRFTIRILITLYMLSIIALGYWYWMRPVRADQINTAYSKWHDMAEIFNVPLPKDERWQ